MKALAHNRALLFGGTAVLLVAALMFVVAPLAFAASCFPDVGGHWAESFICWLANNGITSGYPDGTYRPDNNVSRAEMAVFIQRVHQLSRWGQTWSGTGTGLTLHNSAGGSDPQVRLETSNSGQQYGIWAGSGGFSVDDPNAGTEPLFIPYGAPDATIVSDSSGRVGMGTWAPNAGLEVSRQSSAGVELRLTETGSSSSDHSRMVLDTAGGDWQIGVNAGNGVMFINRPGSSDSMDFNTDGTVEVNILGPASATHLCRTAGGAISSCSSAAEYVGTIDNGDGFPEAADLVSLVPAAENPYGDTHATFVAAKSNTKCDSNLLGFVLDPELGADGDKVNDHYLPLAIYGYFPAKVTMEGGPIQTGDGITSSSTPGSGMKANEACRIVGYALEDANEDGIIMVFAHLTDYIPPDYMGRLNELLAGN